MIENLLEQVMGVEPMGQGEWEEIGEEDTIRTVTLGAVVAAAPQRNQQGEGAGTHTISHGRLSQAHLSVMRQIHNLGGLSLGQGSHSEDSERNVSDPRGQLLMDIRRGRQLRVVNRSREFYVQRRRARRAATHPVNPHLSFLEEIRLGRNRVLERIVSQEARGSEGGRLYPPFFAGT